MSALKVNRDVHFPSFSLQNVLPGFLIVTMINIDGLTTFFLLLEELQSILTTTKNR